jgi:hypothetical protein
VEAARGEVGVAAAALFEGAAGGVECVAVYLDDDAFIAPEEVDFVRAEADVGLGFRQVRSANEGQESALGVGARQSRALLDRRPEPAGAAMPWMTSK